MTRDSGSGRNGEDSRSEAECEAPQSGPAKTGHRPTSGATQEIINRLKELLAKATPGPWALKVHTGNGESIRPSDDWTVRGADGNGVCFEGQSIPQADANARLIVEAINFLRDNVATLTNLTPSEGVERIRAEAFEEAAKVADDGAWESSTEAGEVGVATRVAKAIRALAALPSEPPSQGDVEGRARGAVNIQICWSEDAPSVLCLDEEPIHGSFVSGAPYKAASVHIDRSAIIKALASKDDWRS